MKEQIKAPEKLQLSDKDIAKLSYAEFKTLAIRMLMEIIEYGCKIEEKVKAMKSEIKENAEGTNSDRKETGTQINSLEQKEEINIQSKQIEETRIQTHEERVLKLQDNFKLSNIRVIGVPEREEEAQEIENLFEQIMKKTSLIWQKK